APPLGAVRRQEDGRRRSTEGDEAIRRRTEAADPRVTIRGWNPDRELGPVLPIRRTEGDLGRGGCVRIVWPHGDEAGAHRAGKVAREGQRRERNRRAVPRSSVAGPQD